MLQLISKPISRIGILILHFFGFWLIKRRVQIILTILLKLVNNHSVIPAAPVDRTFFSEHLIYFFDWIGWIPQTINSNFSCQVRVVIWTHFPNIHLIDVVEIAIFIAETKMQRNSWLTLLRFLYLYNFMNIHGDTHNSIIINVVNCQTGPFIKCRDASFKIINRKSNNNPMLNSSMREIYSRVNSHLIKLFKNLNLPPIAILVSAF